MLLAFVALCAHMHTLIPDHAFLRKGRLFSIRYLYCHPYEHELLTQKKPAELFVISPRGETEDLLPSLKEAKEGFTVAFRPMERGDYYLVLRAHPLVEEGTVIRASAKVVLHVQAQKGWDRRAGKGLDIVPLTRPYGLRPGTAFRARVTWNGEPVAGVHVEIEKYNPAPPKELPDDAFVTGVVKTDKEGIFVATPTEPGWWSVTVRRPCGKETRAGKRLESEAVLTFWFPVGIE